MCKVNFSGWVSSPCSRTNAAPSVQARWRLHFGCAALTFGHSRLILRCIKLDAATFLFLIKLVWFSSARRVPLHSGFGSPPTPGSADTFHIWSLQTSPSLIPVPRTGFVRVVFRAVMVLMVIRFSSSLGVAFRPDPTPSPRLSRGSENSVFRDN